MMKFTDLNIDCLETVLEHLDVINLLNVADSTKRLRKAGELVFARKYGDKTIMFRDLKISPERLFSEGSIYIKPVVVIEDLKTALQLLRCFGCVVSKIDLLSDEDAIGHHLEIYRKLLTYINNYCAEHLDQLEIHSANKLLEYFNRPFSNLTIFRTSDDKYTEKCCLNRLFPKMKQLRCVHIGDGSFYDINTKHFPHLKELKILDLGYVEHIPGEIEEKVIEFLQLNPQLKEFSIQQVIYVNGNLDINVLRNAVDSLQNIETLILMLQPSIPLNNGDNIIHMRSVKTFKIYFLWFTSESACWLPFSFEELEIFSVHFPEKCGSSFLDEFYSFISKHSSITNLQIYGGSTLSHYVDWLRLAKYLPLLAEIIIRNRCFSADEVISFLANFHMLKNFYFRLDLTNASEYDILCNRLGGKWVGRKTEFECFELERRF